MAEATTTTTTTAATDTRKRKQLPKIDRVHKTKEELDKAQVDALSKGYKDYAVQKFEVEIAGKKGFILAYNESDSYSKFCESGVVACSSKQLDAAPKAKRKLATVDSVMSVISGFNEADKARIKAALSAKK